MEIANPRPGSLLHYKKEEEMVLNMYRTTYGSRLYVKDLEMTEVPWRNSTLVYFKCKVCAQKSEREPMYFVATLDYGYLNPEDYPITVDIQGHVPHRMQFPHLTPHARIGVQIQLIFDQAPAGSFPVFHGETLPPIDPNVMVWPNVSR